uniref:Uncharacterized protein n=1 Tax=Aegilops tauschii subsp. strangulata TaxID=200361 RepID=A0A453BGF0_AEGTS
MGMSGAASGGAGCGRGEYMRIPEDVDAIKEAVKEEGECPRLLRCRAIRWWAKVAVLGIFLAGAAAAAVVFLGPLVIKKVRPLRVLSFGGFLATRFPPPNFVTDARSFFLSCVLLMLFLLSLSFNAIYAAIFCLFYLLCVSY